MRLTLLLAIIAVALAGCATQPAPMAYDVPGFLMGFVHGIIAPFSLAGELLSYVPAFAETFSNVRVYAFPNSGGWYDFGFMVGLWCWGLMMVAGTAE